MKESLILNNSKIEFMQGDSYTVAVDFNNINKFKNVYFTCKELNICELMFQNGNTYIYKIPSELTKHLKFKTDKIATTYNITIHLTDNETVMSSDNSELIVYKKDNEVTCEVQ